MPRKPSTNTEAQAFMRAVGADESADPRRRSFFAQAWLLFSAPAEQVEGRVARYREICRALMAEEANERRSA